MYSLDHNVTGFPVSDQCFNLYGGYTVSTLWKSYYSEGLANGGCTLVWRLPTIKYVECLVSRGKVQLLETCVKCLSLYISIKVHENLLGMTDTFYNKLYIAEIPRLRTFSCILHIYLFEECCQCSHNTH